MGKVKEKIGPLKFPRSSNLSNNLNDLGFKLIRLKTGTPPRVDRDTIDFDKMEIQNGTNAKLHFSFYGKQYTPYEKQTPCYLTHTNAKTHEIILTLNNPQCILVKSLELVQDIVQVLKIN